MKPEEIARKVDAGEIITRRQLHNACRSISYSEVLKHVTKDSSRQLLIKKPTRSKSGVSVIAVMCAPHECPGTCVYCPGGDKAPQSYTGEEPAALRARNNDFNSYSQVMDRLKQYEDTGHDSSKIELIVMGGNFLSTSIEYQESFMRGIYQALNGTKTESLDELKKENETALHRCVALTFETRPDVCSDELIERMLYYGATRVELGCQSVYDDVLERVKRGHDVQAVKEAVKRLKNAGFKVDLHLMPGLPGSDFSRDVKMFKTVFKDPDFKPDGLKIYPCLVMLGTELYDDWKRGDYEALDSDTAAKIIAKGLSHVPVWVRVKRVMRDIPTTIISDGPRKSNLRELVWREMIDCNCIRCREAGRGRTAKDSSLSIIEYEASDGIEYFISFEDFKTGALIGFARLRLADEAFLRELHVYGQTTSIGEGAQDLQHKGYGRRLLCEAEQITQREGYPKLKVLSGVGVRQYYIKNDYSLDGFYVSKNL